MNFTKSRDGILRTTIRPRAIRVTREDLDKYTAFVREMGYQDLRSYINERVATWQVVLDDSMDRDGLRKELESMDDES